MEGHTGLVNGSLNHQKLKHLTYNFRFNTNNMLVYHTEKETPEFPFYGTIYTTGEVLLRGGNNALNVDGTLRTDPRTSFTYVTATAGRGHKQTVYQICRPNATTPAGKHPYRSIPSP